MSPWKAGKDGRQGHHPLPKAAQKKTLGRVYDDTTVRVTPKDHQKMHRDEKEVGPIGRLARQDRRVLRRSKKKETFCIQSSQYQPGGNCGSPSTVGYSLNNCTAYPPPIA